MNSDSILIKRYMQAHSKMAARTLEDIEPEKLAGFFNDSPIDWLLEVIPHMDPQRMSEVFEGMNPERLVQFFESMEMDQMLVSIRRMNQDLKEAILNGLTQDKSVSAKALLQYLDHSVGAYMDSRIFTLSENLTVKEALLAIKGHKEQVQPQLFIIGSGHKFSGVVSLSDLVSGNPGMEIKSMMNTKVTTFSPETPIQSVLSHHEWQNFYALPVVDHASLFLGTIRLETIRSILIQSGSKGEEMGQLAISALGELYRLGLAGLLRGATDIAPPSKE